MLYTVRDDCERDLEGALRTVADLGYEGVEFWQLHGHEPTRVRDWLEDTGLVAVGRHANLNALERNLPLLAGELAVLGTDRIALSSIEPDRAGIRRIADIAEATREIGLRLGFHNHGPEVQPLDDGDETFLDLLRGLPPELLWLELDLGWVWYGGVDPVAELAKTSGRCPLVHVKDFRNRDEPDDVPIGDGAVGYEPILAAAVSAGVEWLVVEQDEVEGPPFEAVRRSFEAVHTMLADIQ